METEEDIDLGGEGVADPFDGDPADEPATGVVDVSDGPEEARLGGVNILRPLRFSATALDCRRRLQIRRRCLRVGLQLAEHLGVID